MALAVLGAAELEAENRASAAAGEIRDNLKSHYTDVYTAADDALSTLHPHP